VVAVGTPAYFESRVLVWRRALGNREHEFLGGWSANPKLSQHLVVAIKKPHVHTRTSGLENPELRSRSRAVNKLIFFTRIIVFVITQLWRVAELRALGYVGTYGIHGRRNPPVRAAETARIRLLFVRNSLQAERFRLAHGVLIC